jgi:sugar phosphate isomerase/epimerase
MPGPHRRRFLRSAAAAPVAACGFALGANDRALGQPGERGAAPRKFKLGTVTYNIAKDWDLPTLLDICKKTGLAAVECRTTHKHGVEPSLSSEQRAEVKKRFADSGVIFWGCGSVCEFHAPEPAKVRENIETCKRFVELVAEIGGRGVKVRPNGLPKGVPVEKTLEQIGKSLIECGKAAADHGLEIWAEVHGPGTSEPMHMKTVMEHCGLPNVGLTWNSNQTDLVKGSVAEAFALLKPWIKSCHINDLYNDQRGVYPYRELFRLLREIGYDRYTLCEVGRAMPDLPSGIEFLKYYHALWNELSK